MKLKDYLLFFFGSVFFVIILILIFTVSLRLYHRQLAVIEVDKFDLSNSRHVRAKNIMNEILIANRMDTKQFHLKIMTDIDNYKNFASSHPGNVVMLSHILLELIKSKQGLAYLIAHELAHIELGHLYQIESLYLDRTIDEFGVDYYTKYNYKKEFEADELAVIFLKRTYGTLIFEDITEFYSIVKQVEKNQKRLRPRSVSLTHPSDAKRLEFIRHLVQKNLRIH
jgi:Zn-dependent protease with chaperone function